jgi:hypothetical protein
MNCAECRDLMVAELEGALDAGRAGMVREHLAGCDACRADADALKAVRERLVRLGESVSSTVALERPVMDKILSHEGHKVQEGRPMFLSLRRVFSHPLRLTAASIALLAIAGVVIFPLLGGHSRYALAQTVEAQRAVRTVHVTVEQGVTLVFGKDGTPEYPLESDATEMWAELDGAGKLVSFRIDRPFTLDGPKIVLWRNGKASVWFPSKNVFDTASIPESARVVPQQFKDPNAMVTDLQKRAAEGKVKIIEAAPTEPYKQYANALEWAPKVLVVNPPEPQGEVEVYVIDPKTKLLQQMERYRKNGSELVLLARYCFNNYNLPIAADVFAPQLPPDVVRIDQTAMKEVGLAQGQMTDAEVAKAVTRQFWEAIIAGDYDKASVLMLGYPAARLKPLLGPVVEIISIGEAKADPQFKWYNGLFVPYEVKLKDGTIRQGRAAIRPVEDQPHRWFVDGGI